MVRWASCAVTRDFCSALAALAGPVQNIFFLTVHYFSSFAPIAQQAGQAAVLGRLSLSMFLCASLTPCLLSLLSMWQVEFANINMQAGGDQRSKIKKWICAFVYYVNFI